MNYLKPEKVCREGFEPSPPKREQLKCSALDHSANDTNKTLRGGIEPPIYRLTAGRLNHWANRA